ncbi:hypothetical protein RA263_27320 [Pseudomonas syringae pv. tagetis]|uniref:Uncharacterized protein n=4 Tax=Pseudomonas syringae group TaxID=136849 RepID=A0A0N8T3K0_9PSED|nr:hypothetical protein [Pseudomonas syringae group genomosp. 7]KPX39697.1 hypothetical protein ALO68_101692 [Pseudomonas syringae pv. helianthi]KPY85808.1 hypothetical protein ALO44_101580 [Pseudomonas syringae pv. tagetis]RMW13966.1 hypothetical protein ALO98_200290 [Pseudomonas syringae pv. tagetis]RMW27821.1 hypothetical protein ALO97_200152 [Pseudomonas syringae pv. tagetis]UNB62825.1 hypothetical protein MME54_25115 [Pseudomonas syringae pv. helianthi]
MSHDDLIAFKNLTLEHLENNDFQKAFSFNTNLDYKVSWSKGPACSIIPLDLEMSGVKPAEFLAHEPKNKKNVYKNYFLGNTLIRVESFDRMGLLSEIESTKTDSGIRYSIRKNNFGEVNWLKAVEFEKGLPIRACRIDSDSEFWSYRYKWENMKIVEITTFSSNSIPGIRLFVDYSGDAVNSIFFDNKGSKIVIYNKND